LINYNRNFFAIFLIIISIFLITCTPKNSNRQIVQNYESSDVLNNELAVQEIIVQIDNNGKINPLFDELSIVESQESNFLPGINLIQYSKFASDFHPGRYARIWGWSTDEKAAYSIEGRINSEASYQIDFFIFDLVANNVLVSLTIYPDYAEGWADDETFFEVQGADILNALRTYEIIEQQTDFLPFPMTRNNILYNAQITDIEYGEDEQWLLGDTILSYVLSVTANDSKKIIGTFTPFLWLYDVDICGYFLSPFDNRILIVVAEDLGFYQHGGILYRFIGFQL